MLFIDNKDSVFCILYSVMCSCVRTAVFFVFFQEVLSGWFFFNGFTDLIMYKFSGRLVTLFLRERSWGWMGGGRQRERERERD